MLRNILVSLCALCLLSACVTTDTVRFDDVNRSFKEVDNVRVLTENPDRSYKKIARIQVGPDAFISSYEAQTKEIIQVAAELGADAVIISFNSRMSSYLSGNVTTGVFGGTSESKFTVGEAIVFE